MSKCGCSGSTCSCKIVGGNGVVVTGAGSATNPYVIQTGTALSATDTATIDLTLLGNGSTSAPWQLSADLTAGLDDLVDVDTSGGLTGQVLARQADGTYSLVPPATAAPGAIAAAETIQGDGSSGAPLKVRMAPLSGLTYVAGGLTNVPFTVASEADLDVTYGALPAGSVVSKSDGTEAWMKTSSGWLALLEDTGTQTLVNSSTVTMPAGFTCNNLSLRRRNGIVQMWLTFTPSVSITGSGNILNKLVATLNQAEFRPVFSASLTFGGRAGQLGTGEALANGAIVLGAIHDNLVAGDAVSVMGTWIGA